MTTPHQPSSSFLCGSSCAYHHHHICSGQTTSRLNGMTTSTRRIECQFACLPHTRSTFARSRCLQQTAGHQPTNPSQPETKHHAMRCCIYICIAAALEMIMCIIVRYTLSASCALCGRDTHSTLGESLYTPIVIAARRVLNECVFVCGVPIEHI